MPVTFTETRPEGYKQIYESYLYNSEAFVPLQLGPKTTCCSFYAVDTLAKRIVGKVHFFKKYHDQENIYSSPLKSPFGSFELHPQLTNKQVDDFVQFVLDRLKEEEPAMIYIQHHAAIYHPENTARVKESLLKEDFKLKNAIPNHHIIIDQVLLENKIYRIEKRRLQKCQKAGFFFQEEEVPVLSNVYDFVLACRKEKGWRLSMSYDKLQETVSLFPDNYKLFSVYNGRHRIASTVAVLVNSRILYNFYAASLQNYDKYSPMVMLIHGLYQYSRQKGMKILDLGTSASDSLRLFKTHMGGGISFKFEFVWHSGK